jgi:glutamyl-tRNA synthetase
MERPVRVRFAPSPTGALHIGGVRTALYNYLFAKKHGGKMFLRIEDTDQDRFVPNAEKYIQDALEWCGIKLDESPWHGGEFGPYRQSERKDAGIYTQYAQQLVDEGKAYYAFDTKEELDEMRKRLEAAKVIAPQYNAITRTTMKNSLTLPEDEVKARIAAGEPYIIRIKIPRKEEIRFHDLIRGWIVVHSATLDDKVLMKSDGMPTYHLANIVDDHLMQTTHVIRGEEWLPSAPLHVLLYRYLGWEDTMPQFAHLPLLLKPDGEGKLSKRDGDKFGFSVFPLKYQDPENPENSSSGFREDGYMPDAFINFLAFLGWNPGTQQEIFSMDELAEAFTIERIGKSGVKFDINKAKWFNQQYIKAKPDAELANYLLADLTKNNIACTPEKAAKVASLLKERVVFPKDFYTEGKYFFEMPTSYEETVVAKKWNDEAVNVLQTYKNALQNDTQVLDAAHAKHLIHEILDAKGIKIGAVMQAIRLAITGVGSGADLMEIIAVLGKETVCLRIDNAINTLKDRVLLKA